MERGIPYSRMAIPTKENISKESVKVMVFIRFRMVNATKDNGFKTSNTGVVPFILPITISM